MHLCKKCMQNQENITFSARLSQKWVQGLMSTEPPPPILNRLQNLKIFGELKYVM